MKPILQNLVDLNLFGHDILITSYEQILAIYFNLKSLGYKSIQEDFSEEVFLNDIKYFNMITFF